MQPKSKEAMAKLKASEKMQKEAAFAAAIMTDADVPLAEEINPDEIGERPCSGFYFWFGFLCFALRCWGGFKDAALLHFVVPVCT